jgi:hypothetical protein
MIGGPYEILWSKTPIAEDTSDYVVVKKGETPRDATKVTVTFTVPEATYGRNYVQFRRVWRPEDPYGFDFTVVAGLKVSPTPVSPGAKVTINGDGFPANRDVKVEFDGNATELDIASNGLGTFSTTFTVPNTAAGNHEFKAVFGAALTEYAAASFNIRPTISLEPDAPEIGQEVTVTGHGFAANSTISFKFDDVAIGNSPPTDGEGSFTYTFKVPQTSETKHTAVATDKAGHIARFGMPLESEPPPVPNTTTPLQEKSGWFGPQLVTFNWAESSDPSGVSYILEIGDNLYFFPLQPGMRKTGLIKTNLAVKLGPGTYYWRVKAIDGAGNESEWGLAPYPIKIGFSSSWYLVIGAIVFVIVFILIVRAFFRRVREYYK